jgi:UDP-2,4-diacetamido-2,4,6-trideoxy-beta-L-altropyranose hydrolase
MNERMNDAILIRCDASIDVGLGHLMRCLAVADALRDLGVHVEFAMDRPSEFAIAMMERFELKLHQLAGASARFNQAAAGDLLELMREREIDSILVDHYGADGAFFETLTNGERLVCAIDDEAVRDFRHVHWILNPNPSVSVSEYRVSNDCELLLGPKYALIRKEFSLLRKLRKRETDGLGNRRILIQLGGGATCDLSQKILGWLGKVPDACSIRCIMAHQRSIDAPRIDARLHDISILHDVQDIGEHMAWADIAIGAGGSSCWELCCLGVPMIIGELSTDQSRIAKELQHRGAAILLGKWNQVTEAQFLDAVRQLTEDEPRRTRMAHAGRELVDGRGAIRAAQSIVEKLHANQEVTT